jgi:hypothetical protein
MGLAAAYMSYHNTTKKTKLKINMEWDKKKNKKKILLFYEAPIYGTILLLVSKSTY